MQGPAQASTDRASGGSKYLEHSAAFCEHLKMRRVVTHNKVARYGAEHLEYVKTTEKCAHQTSCWMLAKSVNKILR